MKGLIFKLTLNILYVNLNFTKETWKEYITVKVVAPTKPTYVLLFFKVSYSLEKCK